MVYELKKKSKVRGNFCKLLGSTMVVKANLGLYWD